ncbi:putative DNA-binding protein [Corynebacterium renale]|uniref:DNA-binding protein n=1 Tax=Corynebacterium renale TaxID=1724 RepID=A0A2A9DQ32_9CORY|nr:DNA-binding protein [Corynebacterium renale]PFG28703.1 hypothetical protein ATK06_1822 [Corynebacterium renale]SQG64705.1 putative DNA-binding protein [Corynebacterium renale]SQI26051.1 putative DNA-binding protein [Corynebacterium renale]STC95988.1 putative DNA-binding protein [Corynebacterium renale]
MFAIFARYRGRSTNRAELVRNSAEALSTLPGVAPFEVLGIEDIRTTAADPGTVCDVVMALLSDGQWAVGIGVAPTLNTDSEVSLKGQSVDNRNRAIRAAEHALPARSRAGTVSALVDPDPDATAGANIAAAFQLMGHVLSKRTIEGREATSLVRSGLNQNEAAAELGISKQALSQRLYAAGWHVENAGWKLTLNLLKSAHEKAI